MGQAKHGASLFSVVPGSLRERIQKMERVEASKDKTRKRHRRRVLGTTGERAERTSGEHVKERHRASTWRRRQREGGGGEARGGEDMGRARGGEDIGRARGGEDMGRAGGEEAIG